MRGSNYQNVPVKIEAILDKRKFVIPQFQRKIVWTNKRREDFLRNILIGDPFGVLLIRIREDGRYELIDGLQRITTIQDFNENPYKYLNSKDINPDMVDKLLKADYTAKNVAFNEELIEKNRDKWQKKIFKSLEDGGINPKATDIINTLTNDFNLSTDIETWHCVEEIVNDFKDFIDLNNLEVYAINYTGDEENIANVFDNLNTGGVKLGKYDTLSAQWFNKKFIVNDEDLINIVINKYTQLQNTSGMEVDFNEKGLKEDGITFHEYCYALGIIMMSKEDEFDILFGTNASLTEKIGFEILSLLLVGKVNDAKGLFDRVSNFEVSGEFLVQLKELIKESLVYIKNTLKSTLIGLNKSNLHSDRNYLTYHILVSYIKEYYEINLENSEIKEKDSSLSKERFEKYAPLYYLYDCITDYWKEHRQTNDVDKAVSDLARRQRYWYNISYADWKKALIKFMDSQKSVGKTVPQQNKLFIDFLTQLKIRENSSYEDFFNQKDGKGKAYALDIEHITSKKDIGEHITDLDESQQKLFNVSAIGNLCYLTAKDNRAIGPETLYDFVEDRPAFVMSEEFRDCILYPPEEKLNFRRYDNKSFREGYEKFINARQEQLAEEFLRLMKKYYNI